MTNWAMVLAIELQSNVHFKGSSVVLSKNTCWLGLSSMLTACACKIRNVLSATIEFSCDFIHCVARIDNAMVLAGDYAFERTMMDKTLCEVHTFDCTYKAGTSQSPGRHFYHHWCLGEPSQGEQYRTWSNITTSLGHKKVHLLKMDIGERPQIMEQTHHMLSKCCNGNRETPWCHLTVHQYTCQFAVICQMLGLQASMCPGDQILP